MKPPATDGGSVLILAPTGNDAHLTQQFLAGAGIPAKVCAGVPQLCRELEGRCSAIILAEETLKVSSVQALAETLSSQPAWSDIPLIIITSGGEVDQARLRRLAAFGPGSNVTLLERPFRPGTLLSSVQSAVRSRLRQYQVQDLLKELGAARDAAEQANRTKDDFLAALSHELRTPLNPVLLLATEAAANLKNSAEVRADFDVIATNVKLEARLIDDLLDLTRITQGKLVLESRPVSLNRVIRDAIANVMSEIEEKSLKLTLNLWDSNPVVKGDAVRLQQVFWNVLRNAAKFTEPGGKIRVSTRPSPTPGNVQIEFSDSGIGMAAGEISRIFDAFAQGDHAHNGSRHRFGGLGLGLSISRRLVELHSGTIVASSEGLGRGSTFLIELPFPEQSAGRPGVSDKLTVIRPGEGQPVKSLRILVVEDHAPTRAALTHLLTLRTHVVVSTGTVAEARALGERQPFDLLIADIGLPDGSGYELMEYLGARTGMKGIALTGYGAEAHQEEARKAGFAAHVVKPVSVKALESVLSTLDG